MNKEAEPLLKFENQHIYHPEHDYTLIITSPYPNEDLNYIPKFKY